MKRSILAWLALMAVLLCAFATTITPGTAHSDALCDSLRAQYGPNWPCISVPTNTFTPTAPTAAPPVPGTADTSTTDTGPRAGSNIGPGPGTGDDTPIIPGPTASLPAGASTPAPATSQVPAAGGPPAALTPSQQTANALPYGKPGDCGSDRLPIVDGTRTPDQDATYQFIRARTPAYQARQRQLQKEIDAGKWPAISGDNWAMDHVISVDRLSRTPGFSDLDRATQDRITNSPENTRPLPTSWNQSKNNRSYSQWPSRSPTGRIDAPSEAQWKELCDEESRATDAVLDEITNADAEGGSDNRADDANADNQAQSGPGASENLTRTVQPTQAPDTDTPETTIQETTTTEVTATPPAQTGQPTENPNSATQTQTTQPSTMRPPLKLPTTTTSPPSTTRIPIPTGEATVGDNPSVWQETKDTARAGLAAGGAVLQSQFGDTASAAGSAADKAGDAAGAVGGAAGAAGGAVLGGAAVLGSLLF